MERRPEATQNTSRMSTAQRWDDELDANDGDLLIQRNVRCERPSLVRWLRVGRVIGRPYCGRIEQNGQGNVARDTQLELRHVSGLQEQDTRKCVVRAVGFIRCLIG